MYGAYRVVRLRTREEKRIDSLSRQVDILFERLGMDPDRGAP
jgi:hypothetical protein